MAVSHSNATPNGEHVGHHVTGRFSLDSGALRDENSRAHAVSRLTPLVETAAVACGHLASQLDRETAPPVLAPSAASLLRSHHRLLAATIAITDDLKDRACDTRLEGMLPAPLVRPTRTADPILAARLAFDRIRLIAHRQTAGELPAGIDAVRAYATTCALVTAHSHAITAATLAVTSDPTQRHALERTAQSLAAHRDSCQQLLPRLEHLATPLRSPGLLIHELKVLSQTLDDLTRSGSKWRSPADMLGEGPSLRRLSALRDHLAVSTPQLVAAAGTIFSLLHRRGELQMPTAARRDLDHPYVWAQLTQERVIAVHSALRGICEHPPELPRAPESDHLPRLAGAARGLLARVDGTQPRDHRTRSAFTGPLFGQVVPHA